MGLTQKYKQQQQQVRIQTNESNYIKGMQFVDSPLTEGYSRMLVNFDIDSLSGKLIPRKGLKSLGIIHPTDAAKPHLSNNSGYNTVVQSKVCYASDTTDKRQIIKSLQSVLYNTATRSFLIATGAPDITEDAKFEVVPLSIDSNEEYVTPEPFIIANPEIHGKTCIHNNFYKRPVGTFAFGSSYYTFLKHNRYMIKLKATLPNAAEYPNINTYSDLETAYPTGTPGEYFKFTSGDSKDVLAYYNEQGVLTRWLTSEAELLSLKSIPDPNAYYTLCYTKLGAELQTDDVLLDPTITSIDPNVYYVCVVQPDKLNPTEAASWGYNMLLDNPYNFVCESTDVNLVTILGILPYDKDGNIILTPRKNQEITLKAYYRAPYAYHSDTTHPKYYATTKKGEVEEVSDLNTITPTTYGDWWYVTSTEEYHMVMPYFETGSETATKKIQLFGLSKPKASERLSETNKASTGKVHLIWQMRQAGASDWQDIYNEEVLLSDYRTTSSEILPFVVNTTLPAEETMIRLVVTDPADKTYPDATDMPAVDNEYVLSTMSIGLSLVSDDLANTLNLVPKNYDLGQATGMCEWEQRLVLWGVPDALNTIFISDVGNPNFFPYPNNVDIFTDPIIAVHNYGNELLVLTTSALYRLTWDTEGTGWTHTLVQQNLHVTLEDTYMSCVIKNMFFFKSGEYYYMMVPKSSSGVKGDVTIAPISKPIEGLLDNFHEEMYNLIRVMSDQQTLDNFTDRLVNYFSYIDNTKVVVNYVYSLNKNVTQTSDSENTVASKYLYIQLIYDTDARTWSMRVFEAAHMLYASHADAIQQDRFIDVTPSLTSDNLVLQYYQFQDYADTSIQYIKSDSTEVPVARIIKNYQYLDTGNREINTELKKRFREFQFKIKNNNATNLGFYTSFLIDGSLRKDLQRYEPRYILDEKTNEATIIVERVLDPNAMTYKTNRIERIIIPERMLQDSGELTPTILANTDDVDRWILNQSAFPGRTLCKIRMPISGKGLSPRAILLSTNEQNFEILGHCWVYRTMNSR